MKGLAAALLLVGGLALNGYAQNFDNLPRETNPRRYLSSGQEYDARITILLKEIGGDRAFNFFWRDWRKDGIMQSDEVDIDVDGDNIADMPLDFFIFWYNNERARKKYGEERRS